MTRDVSGNRYPFGQPVGDTSRSPDRAYSTMVVGAYPSALHVHWRPPASSGGRGITALAVADEPEPFWNGQDAAIWVDRWRSAVPFDPDEHGSVTPATANGTSGRALDEHYLTPLGLERTDCWITDCLTTYRASTAGQAAVAERFSRWAEEAGVDAGHVPGHPTEGAIVREALARHGERLIEEFDQTAPERVITLGNAALRVMSELLEVEGLPGQLEPETYGRSLLVDARGTDVEWLPLAHPGAVDKLARWKDVHGRWERLRNFQRQRGGRLYQRVVVAGEEGDWPTGTPRHAVDPVHFPDHETPGFLEWSDHRREFKHDVRWYPATVLTARDYHARPLLGELIGGRELLSRSYPDHHRISCCALSQRPEANIDWVYRRNGIEVVVEPTP